MKLVVFIFFVIIFSILKAIASIGKGTVDIAKSAYETVYKNPLENHNNEHIIDVSLEVNNMIQSIKDNFEGAFCILSIKYHSDYDKLLFETVCFYRVLATLILTYELQTTGMSKEKNILLLTDFTFSIDREIVNCMKAYDVSFSYEKFVNRYNELMKPYSVLFANYIQECANNNLSNPQLDTLTAIAGKFIKLHLMQSYLMQKTDTIEDVINNYESKDEINEICNNFLSQEIHLNNALTMLKATEIMVFAFLKQSEIY